MGCCSVTKASAAEPVAASKRQQKENCAGAAAEPTTSSWQLNPVAPTPAATSEVNGRWPAAPTSDNLAAKGAAHPSQALPGEDVVANSSALAAVSTASGSLDFSDQGPRTSEDSTASSALRAHTTAGSAIPMEAGASNVAGLIARYSAVERDHHRSIATPLGGALPPADPRVPEKGGPPGRNLSTLGARNVEIAPDTDRADTRLDAAVGLGTDDRGWCASEAVQPDPEASINQVLSTEDHPVTESCNNNRDRSQTISHDEKQTDKAEEKRPERTTVAVSYKGNAQNRKGQSAPPSRQPRPARPGNKTGGPRSAGEDGEAWSAFLQRAALTISAKEVPDEAVPLFEAFRTTDNLSFIFASFARLWDLAVQAPRRQVSKESPTAVRESDSDPPWAASSFPYESLRVLLGGQWKAKQLWEKLDKRCSRPEYADMPCASGRLAGLTAVVVGSGPCGLRTAIELRLLGARVTVVEKRDQFSRINRLHLWTWCGDEIKALGARCLEPPGADFGSNADKLHIGIGELQTLLLKTALLLGVEVLLGAAYAGYEWSGGWSVKLTCTARDDGAPSASPSPPSSLSNVGVLLGADGLGSGSVGKSAGAEAVEVGSLRAEDAIGLVVNFAPSTDAQGRKSVTENSLRSFAIARQFFGPLFEELAKTTGAELENVVYMKSKLSHYIIMTPTRRCLVTTGVIKDEQHKPVLASENLDANALDTLAQKVAAFKFKSKEATLKECAAEVGSAKLKYADGGPQLFDFSGLRRATEGVLFCDPPAHTEEVSASNDVALMVVLVGDALLEPFWPEGLGIVRGFHSAFDAGSAVVRWASGDSRAATRQHHMTAYTQLKTLSSSTRASVLRPDESKYGLDPSSRYRYVADDVAAQITTKGS